MTRRTLSAPVIVSSTTSCRLTLKTSVSFLTTTPSRCGTVVSHLKAVALSRVCGVILNGVLITSSTRRRAKKSPAISRSYATNCTGSVRRSFSVRDRDGCTRRVSACQSFAMISPRIVNRS